MGSSDIKDFVVQRFTDAEEEILQKLGQYGTVLSRIIKSSIYTMDGKLRHVETFRRVCCVVVRDGVTQLNVSLMFKTVKREHRIFAATERLMCYECGVYGHTRQNCPHVKKTCYVNQSRPSCERHRER